MAKYRFKLGNWEFTTAAPKSQKNSQKKGVGASRAQARFDVLAFLPRLLHWIGFAAILTWSVFVGAVATLHINFESVGLLYSLALVITLLGLWALVSVLVGRKFTVDPPALVPVLIFALLTTTAYLISPDNPLRPSDARNTFGVANMRHLAAIGVIAFIFLYYFSTVFIRTFRQLNFAVRAMFLGLGLTILAHVWGVYVSAGATRFSQLNESITIITVAIPTLMIALLYRSGRNWAKFAQALSLIATFILVMMSGTLIAPKIGATVGLLAIYLITYLNEPNSWKQTLSAVKNQLAPVFNGKTNVTAYFAETRQFWMALFLISWIIFLVLWFILNRVDLAEFARSIVSDWKNVFDSIDNFRELIVGNGAQGVITNTTAADVLSFQGLLGFLGYVVVGLSALIWGVRKARYEVKNLTKDYMRTGMMFLPLILGGIVTCLVGPFNLLPSLIWWFALSLIVISAVELPAKLELQTLRISARYRGKLEIFAKLVRIALLVAIVIALWTLVSMSVQLFNQGVI